LNRLFQFRLFRKAFLPRSQVYPHPFFLFLCVCLLLVAFWAASSGLRTDSLWNDEAWSVWAVHSPSLIESLARIRADVHPPLYFLLLYGWTRVGGESEYGLRLLSTLLGMIGLAGTYAVGKMLVDRWTGLLALVILGASGFFIYYTREARMYTLLLALSALSTWVYMLWRKRPTRGRRLAYALLMTAMLYTHYSGALVMLTHFAHLVVTVIGLRMSKVAAWKLLIPYVLASLFYLPWLPIFLGQMRANPNGPLAIPVPTDWGAVAAIVLILTGGNWGLVIAPFLLGSAIPQLRRYGGAVLLIVLWLLLTPIVLLALNAWVAPVYQVRYAIAMLPAGALLLAYGLRWVGPPERIGRIQFSRQIRYTAALAAVVVLVIAFVQVQWTVYPELWSQKSDWKTVIEDMVVARQPLEPTITDLADYSPSAYYDRRLGIRQGISLDLAWRLHNAWEISDIMERFEDAPPVWVALPINTAKTWHILAALDAERHIGYRSSMVNMVFYRFDPGEGGDLSFRFGDWLRYMSGPGADEHFSVRAGTSICVEMAFEALAPLDDAYSAGLHLVDITGSTSVAQWDGGLGAPEVGDSIDIAPCINIAADVPPGYYHLEMVVYGWADQKRLPLFEDSGDPALLWGDVLMLAAVDVME
jgi:hypothetical protein